MTLSAAIDFSGREVSFAFGEKESGNVINHVQRTMTGREGAGLLDWINMTLAENQLAFSSITEWTIGSGPGSFTGLRLVSSLFIGLSYHNPQLKVRALSSAIALTDALANAAPESLTGVIYKGKIDDLLIFSVKKTQADYTITDRQIITYQEITPNSFDQFDQLTCLTADWDVLTAKLPHQPSQTPQTVDHIPVDKFLSVNPKQWDKHSLLNLEYIRPPVHVVPKESRIIS